MPGSDLNPIGLGKHQCNVTAKSDGIPPTQKERKNAGIVLKLALKEFEEEGEVSTVAKRQSSTVRVSKRGGSARGLRGV
jgi:hypothetical protein